MSTDPKSGESRGTELQLWCAVPDDLLDAGVAGACTTVLSEDERERAARFRFDRHRRVYVATHALARRALEKNGALAARDWRFAAGPLGKPAVEPDCGLRFNLSNCQGLAVCLLSTGTEVGVDIEPLTRGHSIMEVAGNVFSAAEGVQLDALKGASKADRAVSLWVLKEAYVKALGTGLAPALRNISFVFGEAAGIRLESDASVDVDPARWRYCMLDLAGHRVAMVVEGAPAGLEVWEARPPLGEAKRIAAGVEWFPK